MRDITLEDTIFATFSTRAFATGAPTTLAGTPVVSAYENADLTQITAGITLGVDHDGVTGLHMLTVVATAANGYEAGKDYSLVITTGTVGGVSVVGEVVAEFTIGRSAAAVDLANATDGLGALKAETAAILVDTGTTLDAALAVVDANVDAILLDTAEIGAAGAGLTAIDLPNQTMDITGNLSGSVGSVTGAVGSVTGAVGSVTGDIGGVAAGGLTADAIADDLRDLIGAMESTTIATLASQTVFTLTAGSADAGAYVGATIVVTDAVTNAQKAVGICSAYAITTREVTLAADPGVFTMAVGDIVNVFPASPALPAALADGAGGLPISDAGGLALDTQLAATNEVTAARMAALTDWIDGGRLDLIIDAINVIAADWTDAGRLDALLDAIKAVTDALPDAGALTTLQTGTTADADIQSRLPAALVGGLINANVDAINGDTVAAEVLEALMDGGLIIQVNDAAATTTAFAADGFTEATDDHFNGRLITFISGALRFQQTAITDYDALGHVQGSQAFVVDALTEAPANNDFAVVH